MSSGEVPARKKRILVCWENARETVGSLWRRGSDGAEEGVVGVVVGNCNKRTNKGWARALKISNVSDQIFRTGIRLVPMRVLVASRDVAAADVSLHRNMASGVGDACWLTRFFYLGWGYSRPLDAIFHEDFVGGILYECIYHQCVVSSQLLDTIGQIHPPEKTNKHLDKCRRGPCPTQLTDNGNDISPLRHTNSHSLTPPPQTP